MATSCCNILERREKATEEGNSSPYVPPEIQEGSSSLHLQNSRRKASLLSRGSQSCALFTLLRLLVLYPLQGGSPFFKFLPAAILEAVRSMRAKTSGWWWVSVLPSISFILYDLPANRDTFRLSGKCHCSQMSLLANIAFQ